MVTLKVTARQAEALHLAQSEGTISLTLRNPLHTRSVETTGVSIGELSEALSERLQSLAIDDTPTNPEPIAPTFPMPYQYVPTMPQPATPVATENKEPEEEETKTEEPEETPAWELTIIRGTNRETRSFPVNEGNND